MQSRFGKLYTKAYGNLRLRNRRKREVNIKAIEFQKPARQIGLDQAIKQEQLRKERAMLEKKKLRRKQIQKIGKGVKKLSRAIGKLQ